MLPVGNVTSVCKIFMLQHKDNKENKGMLV